jgi:hypothetical protein
VWGAETKAVKKLATNKIQKKAATAATAEINLQSLNSRIARKVNKKFLKDVTYEGAYGTIGPSLDTMNNYRTWVDEMNFDRTKIMYKDMGIRFDRDPIGVKWDAEKAARFARIDRKHQQEKDQAYEERKASVTHPERVA